MSTITYHPSCPIWVTDTRPSVLGFVVGAWDCMGSQEDNIKKCNMALCNIWLWFYVWFQLVASHGLEADRHLFRSLFSFVDLSSDPNKSVPTYKDSLQLQLLSQECSALLSKPALVSVLCFAFDQPLNRNKVSFLLNIVNPLSCKSFFCFLWDQILYELFVQLTGESLKHTNYKTNILSKIGLISNIREVLPI